MKSFQYNNPHDNLNQQCKTLQDSIQTLQEIKIE